MIISVLNVKSISIRKVLSGKPSILIYRGKIDEKKLKKERLTINELQERLRGDNVFNLEDVEYAILETNGEISVILKPEKRGIIVEDLNLDPEYEGITYDLVVDGKIMKENLEKLGKDEIWLKNELKKFKTTPNNTLIATIDGKGSFFCQLKERNRG